MGSERPITSIKSLDWLFNDELLFIYLCICIIISIII